jgi:hypothetical protein
MAKLKPRFSNAGFFHALLICWIITGLFSCKIIHSMHELNREEAQLKVMNNEKVDLMFLPMHHLGKKVFYDDVRSKIVSAKAEGYTVYYELISTDFTTDSILKDNIRRKVRKIKGFSGTYKDNAQGVMFEKYIQQPSYQDMGVTEGDIRADVNYLELMKKWEELNGEIVLDSVDWNTPFDKKFDKGLSYSKEEYNRVFIEYRNEQLIQRILNNSDKKVLVVYGEGHRKDFKKRWKKANK